VIKSRDSEKCLQYQELSGGIIMVRGIGAGQGYRVT